MAAGARQYLLAGVGVAERLLVEDQAVSGDRSADGDREPLAVDWNVGVECVDAAADRAGDARAGRNPRTGEAPSEGFFVEPR